MGDAADVRDQDRTRTKGDQIRRTIVRHCQAVNENQSRGKSGVRLYQYHVSFALGQQIKPASLVDLIRRKEAVLTTSVGSLKELAAVLRNCFSQSGDFYSDSPP